MTGFTYREACLLQSALLRERAQEIAEVPTDSVPLDELIGILGELQDLQEQVHQIEEFIRLLDSRTLSAQSFRIGRAN